MALDLKLRSPKEQPLFTVGMIFSAMFWLGMILSIIGILYGLMALAFVLMAHALFLAHIKGNGLRVSERQLPALYQRCKDAAARLGLAEVPAVYLVQSHGVLNAFATKLLSRRFIVIYSELATHCLDPRQLDFVIGHELGHLAAGHLKWNAFLLPFRLFPWLGAAYSRACEYTSDRCGYAVVGDLEASLRGLVVLAAGSKFAASVDLEVFIEQRQEAGQFWMAVLELVSSHPYLCKRAAALKDYVIPGSVQPVKRNIFAYPLAPVFGAAGGGAAAGGVMVTVALIGVMAALAIPAFMKYQQRAQLFPGSGHSLRDRLERDPAGAGDPGRQAGPEEEERR